MTIDLFESICRMLGDILPGSSDPDMVLNNLERFILASRSPLATAAMFDRDPTGLPILCKIFAASQYLSDLLIRDREAYDALRLTEGQPIARSALIDDLCTETQSISDIQQMVLAVRRFKQREFLRIAYGDIIAGQQIRDVTAQISYVADAICQAAIDFCWRQLVEKFGPPQSKLRSDNKCRFVLLALGKLGGNELNYSSDIDLIFVYESDGNTGGGRRTHRQFFDRLVQDFVKILSEPSALGTAYRVDFRLRPEGKQGPLTVSAPAALQYYEMKGRSWERQALVKARPIAGDIEFGRSFLKSLQPWIYQPRWSRVEIESMKALKRKIERQTRREGQQELNVKTGHGGIRDIEFVIQFLQLLNGNALPEVRANNTLAAIDHLQTAGCLTKQEQQILHNNYCWLRKVEHRLQIMFDWQTHTLPQKPAELTRVALRMGYVDDKHSSALEKFKIQWQQIKDLNRGILEHLLSDAFGSADAEEVAPEVDLILDSEPAPDFIERSLSKYGFQDTPATYRNLMALSKESIPFLSPRRCRHFFAAIAPDLLAEISQTPNPDETLTTLRSVSDMLGGKGTLWELFRFHRPSMELCVKLCAACDYLTQILIRNPGMLDSLLDSLTLSGLPTHEFLQSTLTSLIENAEDIDPILHSFKNDQHLRVGVRDILGRDTIRQTHQALADIAEVIVQVVCEHQIAEMKAKYGTPRLKGATASAGDECELVVLALGKLGGRQPNYHSDLDVVFLYQSDGATDGPTNSTTNQHFFSELGARIINVISKAGPYGRIYEIDCRLRPTGKSGLLAVSFDEFARYFAEGDAQSWERLAMCKARPMFGSEIARKQAEHLATNAIQSQPWTAATVDELRAMRMRMQENCSPRNIKRAAGGTVDLEFIVQMLQLKHGRISPEILRRGTLRAAEQLTRFEYLSKDDFEYLSKSYSFLRDVESRIRLMNTTARHDFPEEPMVLKKLAYLLGSSNPEKLRVQVDEYRTGNRMLFEKFFG
jgi:glutamate-ammonia-ligase adenylyltransferase